MDELDYESDRESLKGRKSRNLSEKKRRDHFNMLINELHLLVCKSGRKMDKTTVLKSTLMYLRNHSEATKLSHFNEIKEDWKPAFLSNDDFTQLTLEAVDSMVLVVTQSGFILYSSESIVTLLNHQPNDLINHSFFDLIHPKDRGRVKNLLMTHELMTGKDGQPDFQREANQLEFTCYIRCGSYVADSYPIYELVEFSGCFTKWKAGKKPYQNKQDDNQAFINETDETENIGFCCTARIQSSLIIREISIASDAKKEFTSRHSMEWKFLFLDHRGPSIIGYLPFEVLGTSGYDYYHPDDLDTIAKCHEQLIHTGEGMSEIYRFLTKGQQWIWIRTHYYITYHQWSSKPEFVVCTNTVVNNEDIHVYLKQKMERNVDEEEISMNDMSEHENTFVVPSPEVASSSTMWPEMKTEASPATPAPQAKSPSPTQESNSTDVVSTQGHAAIREEASNEEAVTGRGQDSSAQDNGIREPVSHVATESTQISVPCHNSSVLPVCTVAQQGKIISPQCLPLIPQKLVMSSVQQQLQAQLQEKHRQLQESIQRQQEELSNIWRQLLLTQRLSVPMPPNSVIGEQIEASPTGSIMPAASVAVSASAMEQSVSEPAQVVQCSQDQPGQSASQMPEPPFMPVPFHAQQQLLILQNAIHGVNSSVQSSPSSQQQQPSSSQIQSPSPAMQHHLAHHNNFPG